MLNAIKLIGWLVWIKVQEELAVRLGVRSRDHQGLPVESLQREAPYLSLSLRKTNPKKRQLL